MGDKVFDSRFSIIRCLARALLGLALIFAVTASGAAQRDSRGPSQDEKPKIQNSPPSRIDPQARALLDRAIQALGGQAFLDFKTLTTSGRAFSISDETTEGFVTYDSAMQYPDKRRLAYGFGKSKPIVLINNGDEAWEVDPQGLTTQRAGQIRSWKVSNPYSLENLLRVRLREPGILVQLGGVDFVELTAVQIVDIFDARHVHVELALSKTTSLPVRISYRVPNPKTGDWDEYADSYSDYQTFQGVATPMHIARYVNGDRVAETFRNKVKYGDVYPLDYFRPAP